MKKTIGALIFACFFSSPCFSVAQTVQNATLPSPVQIGRDEKNASSSAVVTVLTAQGKPAQGVLIRARLTTVGEEPKSMVRPTDEEGKVHLEDLPVGNLSQIAFRFEHWGVTLATTRTLKLSDEGGITVEFVLPKELDDPGSVRVRTMRTIFERKGEGLTAFQYLTLGTETGTISKSSRGFPIPLAQGASGARPIDEEGVPLRIEENIVRIDTVISDTDLEVAFAYDLPINGATVHFEQKLPCAISVAQFISTWTAGDVSMSGRNISSASITQLGSGIAGLVSVGRNFSDGQLNVTLTGLEQDNGRTTLIATAFLSIGLLLLGLFSLVRRKLGSTTKKA